jgi:hypothetical protein
MQNLGKNKYIHTHRGREREREREGEREREREREKETRRVLFMGRMENSKKYIVVCSQDGFVSFVKDEMTICVWVHFWVFNSLIYLSVSVPISRVLFHFVFYPGFFCYSILH